MYIVNSGGKHRLWMLMNHTHIELDTIVNCECHIITQTVTTMLLGEVENTRSAYININY